MTAAGARVLSVPLLAATLAAAETWTAPPEARARVNPVEASDAALLKGRALYQTVTQEGTAVIDGGVFTFS